MSTIDSVYAARSGAIPAEDEPAACRASARILELGSGAVKALWNTHPDAPPLVGRSPAIERVRALIRRIGPTMADVLINGETGTGKEKTLYDKLKKHSLGSNRTAG